MSVRRFDWRDLAALYRNRKRSVYLNSALLLTRGPLSVQGALLSYLAPTMGIFTLVSRGKSRPVIIGQAMKIPHLPWAQMTFLTPEDSLDGDGVLPLLEGLIMEVGARRVYRLLADVDEGSLAFDSLRQTGFSIYSRQRIWRIRKEPPKEPGDGWQEAMPTDLSAIRSLYNSLVPGLVQQVEPFALRRTSGLVYRQGGDLLAYIEVRYGHRGIWAQPFIHPDAENVAENIVSFLGFLPFRRSRPVYVCVRSYQSWLEPAIESLGAEPGPRQAVMVKNLTVQQKALRALSLPVLNGGHAEVSAPLARISQPSEERRRSNGYGTEENYR